MSDVDVIILDIGGGAMLQECLQSVSRQTLKPASVIVFDNGSPTPLRLSGTAATSVIRSEVNLGFAGGVNQALKNASSKYVALINNDVTLDDDWLEVVAAAMARDEKLAAVQSVIRRDEQTVDGAGIDITDGTFRQVGSGESVATPLLPAWGVSATAALYRRAAFGASMFDERFFAYYEDVELCARLHRGGWRTLVIPQAHATHRGSSSASVLGARAGYLRTRNRYWVARLHPGVGRIPALLWEDAKLLLRGRATLRGVLDGLLAPL